MKLKSLLDKEIPVFLAPMAGVTDAPFRNMVSKFGATAVVSEMVSSEALVRNSVKTYRRLTGGGDIKIVQIMGSDPQRMAESAKINEDNGADIVDINMGCPAKKIVNNNSGSALLKDEKLAVKIAETVVDSVKIPVTLKMRLGWDNESKNFRSLAKQFEESGIRMLIVHCRTRAQMYSGTANWEEISDLKDLIKIPYLVNGDIKNCNDVKEALKQSHACGVMIGRAALGKPWLLNQILQKINHGIDVPSPSLEKQYEIVMQHFRNTLDFYGTEHGMRIFRKHFCWYSSGMSGASSFREQINHLDNIESIEKAVRVFYENHF
ncbi:MAG: tRNA dihydrouridine synthase DusB [Alphaproteobacteria bacterium]|nr:tRNA dihydrouridine synthase DusB [Alphaproteobacteria bacterium]